MLKLSITKMKPPLLLRNNGFLSVFFLGVGSAFSKKIYQNNIIIIKGETSIFVDFGTRAPFALNEIGHNVSSINNLILTHSHADHIGGVEEIFLFNRYGFKKKVNLIVPEPYLNILWEESLKGGCSYSEYKESSYLSIFDFINYIKPEPLSIKYKEKRLFYQVKIDKINIIFFQTKHLPSDTDDLYKHHLTFGLIIDNKILFTSDTKFDKDFMEFLVNFFKIQYIFHDCQSYKGGVHASFEEICSYPSYIKEKIFLMHYQDDFEKQDIETHKFLGFAKQWHYYNFF